MRCLCYRLYTELCLSLILVFSFETPSHYVAQAGLDLMIALSQPPDYFQL